MQVVSMDLI